MIGETRSETRAFYVYRTLAWAGRTFPEHTGRMVFRWFGMLAHLFMPGVRATVAENQAQVLGRPADDHLTRAATREAFLSYARYWYDSFHVTRLSDRDIRERVHVEGQEHFDRALERGRGLIVALPHSGNWDVAGRWAQVEGYPLTTVAEELKPERLLRLFLEHRRNIGMDVVALTQGGRVAQQLVRALSENRLVALVADRDLTGNGIEIEMFGRARKLPAGPALLSISSGAPVVVAGVSDEGDDWRLILGPTLEPESTGHRRADVTALTRRIAFEFERIISADPPGWHLFQPGWEPEKVLGG
ncbi:MAG: phosphatidylinositol mannoside acyltransferase [Actinomycetota bacterium]|nr:phosphatidylinositol mannoside acyltransferase [Actinomycetota bacterium]